MSQALSPNLKTRAVGLFLLLGVIACNFPLPTLPPSSSPTMPVTVTVQSAALVFTPTDQPPVPPPASATPVAVAAAPTVRRIPPTVPPPTKTTAPVSVAGCQRPPDDYTRKIINGERLNYRTVWMLQQAQQLYKGSIDLPNKAVTQGSYNPGGVAASFGTHDAGGAVDLSVINPRNGQVYRSELPAVIRALRLAGFAAWVRETNELYKGSPIHIHAIAIGDRELSPAARDQLTGTFGYFLGFNGLPQTNNAPIPDRHGGAILCDWMKQMGYSIIQK